MGKPMVATDQKTQREFELAADLESRELGSRFYIKGKKSRLGNYVFGIINKPVELEVSMWSVSEVKCSRKVNTENWSQGSLSLQMGHKSLQENWWSPEKQLCCPS